MVYFVMDAVDAFDLKAAKINERGTGAAQYSPAIPPRIREWIPDDDSDLNLFNQERDPTGAEPECFDQRVRRSLLDLRSFSDEGGEGVSPA